MPLPEGKDSLSRCVVAGGAGAVGALFVSGLLGEGAEICVIDSRPPPGGAVRFREADVTDIDRELAGELNEADLVLLAVPEPVAIDALPGVAEAMRPGALLVDTLSVHGPFAELATTVAGHVEVLGVNPMFAPSLGMAGRPVAAVITRGGPRTDRMLRYLESWGASVVTMNATEHDRLTSACQAMTHAAVLAFGLALCEMEMEVTDLAAIGPPPHATLLALLARITSGRPEVYWDVQFANPSAPPARAALASAARRFAEVADGGDETEFGAMLDRLRGFLGTQHDRYADACARVFKTM